MLERKEAATDPSRAERIAPGPGVGHDLGPARYLVS